ncbi:MAG: hypothetical protein IMX01_08205 [Limnochordaceae bacterium]|nr:hypothetical protein [Limnochordaceae bacterium]
MSKTQDKVAILQRIVPELADLVDQRYTVLRQVYFHQPVGRRSLSSRLQLPERTIRNEMEILREQGLLRAEPAGMVVTDLGEQLLTELKDLVRQFHGLSDVERRLARSLGLERVIVVPGDSDTDETVKKEMARATARYLAEILQDGDILAVTGGSTMAEVARSLPDSVVRRDVVVVPARGGLGEEVELQANTVAASLARALGATYRLLHLPDEVGEEALTTLAANPKIGSLLELIRQADVVLHGVGSAEEMARRRGLRPDQMEVLRQRRAVGEAFGYYFNREGEIVYSTGSVGLRLEDLERVPNVVAVGGGTSKAEAALAVLSPHYQKVCITDEGAARRMLELLRHRRGQSTPETGDTTREVYDDDDSGRH